MRGATPAVPPGNALDVDPGHFPYRGVITFVTLREVTNVGFGILVKLVYTVIIVKQLFGVESFGSIREQMS